MKILIIVEGATEKAFRTTLGEYLKGHLAGNMPRMNFHSYDKRIPKGDKLKRVVINYLSEGYDAIIALTDVYTGTQPPDFVDATDAKAKMRQWVGAEARFFPHAAQYDFEAWLLPYWDVMKRKSGSNMSKPSSNPELVNHIKPPSKWIEELFRTGAKRSYSKTRDGKAILLDADLSVAISQCAELKALVNTILSLCGAAKIP